MGVGVFVDGFFFLLGPEVDGAVLAGCYAFLFVDGSHPIDRVVVTLQY